jgi:hypothetical protein
MKAGKVESFPEAESEDLSIAKALIAAPEWSKNVPEMFPALRNLLARTTAESGEQSLSISLESFSDPSMLSGSLWRDWNC